MRSRFSVGRCCCQVSGLSDDPCGCTYCNKVIDYIVAQGWSADGPYYNPIGPFIGGPPGATRVDLSSVPTLRYLTGFGFNDLLNTDIIFTEETFGHCSQSYSVSAAHYSSLPYYTTAPFYKQRKFHQRFYYFQTDCAFRVFRGSASFGDTILSTNLIGPFASIGVNFSYGISFNMSVVMAKNLVIREVLYETVSSPFSQTIVSDTIIFNGAGTDNDYVVGTGSLFSTISQHDSFVRALSSYSSQAINLVLTNPVAISNQDCDLVDLNLSGSLVNFKNSFTYIGGQISTFPIVLPLTVIMSDTSDGKWLSNLGESGNINIDTDVSTDIDIIYRV